MTRVTVDRRTLRFPRTVIEPILHGLGSQDAAHSLDDLLRELNTTPEAFHSADFSIDGEQLVTLYHWIRERTQGHIGIRELLSHFSATTAGLAGMAALSARNVRESLLVAVRYLPLLIPAMKAELVEDDRHTRFKLEMVSDLGDLNRLLLELVIAGIHIISNDVMSQPVPRTIHFTHGYGGSRHATDYARELKEILGCQVVFYSSFNGMEGHACDLDIPTRSPNDATFSNVKRILEDEMATRELSRSFTDVARHELMKLANNGRHLTLESFSEKMNMSPRTLIRKLAAEDASFKQLSNEVRFRLARELLEKTGCSIKQIASRAGFNNANSFSRAFKAQYGHTPLVWRDQKKSNN